MTTSQKKDQKLAKVLARSIVEAGVAGIPDMVTGLKKLMITWTPLRKKQFLKGLMQWVRREVGSHTLQIEHAGPLEAALAESLRKQFSVVAGRDLFLETRENDQLIAGLRLTCGDTVKDYSIAGQLDRLARSIK
jgi:hypothetical protein